MTVVSAAGERAFSEIKRLCYMGLDSATLSPRVVERLRRVVPFDGYAVVSIDPLTGLATDFLFSEEMGSKEDTRVLPFSKNVLVDSPCHYRK